jgi:hypothetical protein
MMPRRRRVQRCAVAGTTVLVILIAVSGRALLYRDLPALVTADSWDYLQAALDIRRRLDFYSRALRDVRLPGYAVFLALSYPVTLFRSDVVVLLQCGLGLVNMALGWTMGRLLGSALVSLLMTAFFGLNPVYALNEHAVMSEAFALTLYALLVVVWLAGLQRWSGRGAAVLFGLLLGVSMLTRTNVLALGAVLAFGTAVLRQRADARRGAVSGRTGGGAHLRHAAIVFVVMGAVIVPWLWRNQTAYGRTSLYGSTYSNLLVYKAMHAPLDASTPLLRRVNRKLDQDKVEFVWQQKLQATFGRSAETIARRVLLEQVARHPWRHAADVLSSAAGFIGFEDVYGNERSTMRWWFWHLVRDVPRMNRLAIEDRAAGTIPEFLFVPAPGNTMVTWLFGRLGGTFVVPGRAIAFVVAFVVVGLYLARTSGSRFGDAPRRDLVVVLVVGYLATLGMHAAMTADYDRYSTTFDFVAALIVAIVAADALEDYEPQQACRALRAVAPDQVVASGSA